MPNRLATETSPYLLQHAENPVDWRAWNDEALALARELDMPILLSIGYSSCHWCHVMEHESFEDAATAAYMNEHFVCIKVDREERPDIDALYMEAVQSISGHGGWPLTVFLTPGHAPIFGGTYFPPSPRPGMPSFMQVMESIADAWANNRDEILENEARSASVLGATARLKAPDEPLIADTLVQAQAQIVAAFDPNNGGFGGAPKFPQPSVIEFLLRRPDQRSREIALTSLRKMAAGGIYDQVGGGFARYSVDESWQIPHFEKMLYDNALLARAYLHGFQVSGDDQLAQICCETLDWMLREMTETGAAGDRSASLTDDEAIKGARAGNGFFAALDADSDGEEGKFYAWELHEIDEALGSDAAAANSFWGVIDHGNFEGKNVLFVDRPEQRPDPATLAHIRARLYSERAKRIWPGLDDKRLAAWNALAIAAFADAGAVLNEPRYLEAAVSCAEFVERELRTEQGRLLRTFNAGAAKLPAYLEDYAFLTEALLALYEASFDERWFVAARATADSMIELFADGEDGAFFSTAADHEQLLARRKELEDGAIPSGNSSAAVALLRLAEFTGEHSYRAHAAGVLRLTQKLCARFPLSFGHSLQALDFYLADVREVAIAGPETEPFAAVIRAQFNPHIVLAAGAGTGETAVPLLAERTSVAGQTAAYVCEHFACKQPVTSPSELAGLIAK